MGAGWTSMPDGMRKGIDPTSKTTLKMQGVAMMCGCGPLELTSWKGGLRSKDAFSVDAHRLLRSFSNYLYLPSPCPA